MRLRMWFVGLGLLACAGGCAKVKATVCEGMVPADQAVPVATQAPGTSPGAAPAASSGEDAEHNDAEASESAAGKTPEVQERFALPFAWETSPTEPLSRTRAYLQDVAQDNGAHMRRGAAFFKALAKGESPRATVLSCADSRVQTGAFDASPENDDYMVRNLANQLGTGLGSIQYGVQQLKTPLLVVLGHTGCDAIKAALTDLDGLSEPIQRELAPLRVAKVKGKRGVDDKTWREAVVKNVHDQVAAGLETFAARVNAGELTIVGAIYDFRNDLAQGAGRVAIINVNGVTEAARLKAFETAVLADAKKPTSGAGVKLDPFEQLSRALAEHMHETPIDDDERSKGAVVIAPRKASRGSAAPVPNPAPNP